MKENAIKIERITYFNILIDKNNTPFAIEICIFHIFLVSSTC